MLSLITGKWILRLQRKIRIKFAPAFEWFPIWAVKIFKKAIIYKLKLIDNN
jgi:hypothetical protein